ncbi:MAG: cobyric acid synthase CobQ, partial [Clostridium sp.]
KEEITNVIIEELLKKKGLNTENLKAFNIEEYKETQYDILAQEVRKALDIDYIYKIMGL